MRRTVIRTNSDVYAYIFYISILCFMFHIPLSGVCYSEEETVITSGTIEYDEKTSVYIANGNVKIKKGDTVIEAEEMVYNEKMSDVTATGNIVFTDPNVYISANRAELNLEKETGVLYDAEVVYKADNYRIRGKKIEKKGENYYESPDAIFTTCEGPVPAWCFRARDIKAEIGEELKAKNVSFRIKNIPVLYIPYFRSPIVTERKTGFLLPAVGYSDSRGFHADIPFFWAMSENHDATLNLELYSRRGIGEGLEYRYIKPSGTKGEWRLYHIRDTELHKDFAELRGFHEQRSSEGIGGFVNVNIVNEKDFYREFKTNLEVRTNRFLESTGELMLPLSNGRLYLLSQYWIDLKERSNSVLQKLPEAGFVMNPTKFGHIWLSSVSTISNFWREEGVHGQRLDIFPKASHTFGDTFTIAQTAGLRLTAYSLQRNGTEDTPHREALEYSISGNTRFFKRYKSIVHVVEPLIGYTLVTDSEKTLPVFDSAELFKKTSRLEFSIVNRLISHNLEFIIVRASQGLDFFEGDRPFLPFKIEIGIKAPVSFRLEADYNVHRGEVESINSDLFANVIHNITVSASQRYNRLNDITFYNAGIGIRPYKSLYIGGNIWYDAEEKEAKDITMNMLYVSQCWGINMQVTKRPDDFVVALLIELKGLTRSINF